MHFLWPILLAALPIHAFVHQEILLEQADPDITFSRDWQVLGPFQIGTRGELCVPFKCKLVS